MEPLHEVDALEPGHERNSVVHSGLSREVSTLADFACDALMQKHADPHKQTIS